ncbi:MAG: thioredoxin fold domain-containing protein [Flavitalea sp.]
MNRCLVSAWLIVLSIGIIALFWRMDLIYSLPTPVPQHYQAVNLGERIDLPASFQISAKRSPDNKKPLFLHFFNPDCPCSKFNMAYFQSLVKTYDKQVDFAIVALTNKTYNEKDIQDRFGLKLPVLFDSAIAAACGVYSTPQAAIFSPDQQLYYRGNYNRARYCTDKKSNYAEIALNGILTNERNIMFSPMALKAYGCTLPNCTK